jgi:hypothetical protein
LGSGLLVGNWLLIHSGSGELVQVVSIVAAHLQHVWAVLQHMREHSLAVKKSKCFFGTTSVGYLGHIILAQGVAMDTEKVEAV